MFENILDPAKTAGRWKMFNLPYDSFWCCTATGLENHAKYGDTIYYHKEDRLFVNLFIASELDWSERQVRIRQETDFPNEAKTKLIVKTQKPTRIDLHVRVPYWAKQGVDVKLNGKAVIVNVKAGSYLKLNRVWHDGDRLELQMPMSLHVHRMPDDETLLAFMYGPLVLAGELGGEGLSDENTHTSLHWYKFTKGVVSVDPLIVPDNRLEDWIKPVEGKNLTFQTVGQAKEVTLIPYYKLFDQRHVIYWHVFKEGSPDHKTYLQKLKSQ